MMFRELLQNSKICKILILGCRHCLPLSHAARAEDIFLVARSPQGLLHRSLRRIASITAALALIFASTCALADEYADAVRALSAPPRSGVNAMAMSAWDGSSVEAITPERDPIYGSDTYRVRSAAQLAWLAQNASKLTGDIYIELMTDIDLGGHEWTPISYRSGVDISGSGHVIKGLTITRASRQVPAAGLFGKIEGIFNARDIHFVDVDIDDSTDSMNTAGALIANGASLVKDASITGCTVQGRISVYDSATNVGGLCGIVRLSALRSCVANVEITRNSSNTGANLGGLAGCIESSDANAALAIMSCASFGSITGGSRSAAGIAGLVYGTDSINIRSITNEAEVEMKLATMSKLTDHGAGGIIGIAEAQKTASLSIEDAINKGRVAITGAGAVPSGYRDDASAGGLIGIVRDAPTAVSVSGSSNAAGVIITASGSGIDRSAGGLIGSVKDAADTMDIERSWNTADISCDGSAGGLVGSLSSKAAASSAAEVDESFNVGGVSGGTGSAGGLFGTATADAPSHAIDIEDVYSSAIPTGAKIGGLFGTLANIAPSASDCAFPSSVREMWSGGGASSAAQDVYDRSTYAGWDGYDLSGPIPPELDRSQSGGIEYIHSYAVRSPRALINSDGSFSIPLIEFPDEALLARAGSGIRYSIYEKELKDGSYDTDLDAPLATGCRVVGRCIIVPASAGLTDEMMIAIRGEGERIEGKLEDLSLGMMERASDREIAAISVRGTPLVPSEDASFRLRVEWVDADGVTHSTDKRPTEMPSVSWSIVSANEPNWDIKVTPTSDPFVATLSIGPRKSASPAFQEAGVQVRLSYGAASEDIVYKRKFFAGAFPTQVLVGPDQQEMIDAANAVLARTGVSILPGNFQQPMPESIRAALSDRLAAGLVTYSGVRAAVEAEEPYDIYVLDDLDTIREMSTQSPVESSLPVCFRTMGKDSANVRLDLTKLPADAQRDVVLLPMTYSVTFDADDMEHFFGANSDEILADPSSPMSIARIFEVLVLHKRIHEGPMTGWYTRLVSGVATPMQAFESGMLQTDAADGELTVRLAYDVIDFAGESFVISGQLDDGSGIGYIILPDGEDNDVLIDPLWANAWARTQDQGTGGGGGGGCTTSALCLIALALLPALRATRHKESDA